MTTRAARGRALLVAATLCASCATSAHVLPSAYAPATPASACFARCRQIGPPPANVRCLDDCPGAMVARHWRCAELGLTAADACLETRSPSTFLALGMLSVVLAGVVAIWVALLRGGSLG